MNAGPVLSYERGGRVVEHRVEGDRTVLGRASDVDVVVSGSTTGVSRRHAELLREEDAWVLVDLESRNGTFVNGERIERRAVNDGDVIGLGPFQQLVFRTESAGEGGAAGQVPRARPTEAVRFEDHAAPDVSMAINLESLERSSRRVSPGPGEAGGPEEEFREVEPAEPVPPRLEKGLPLNLFQEVGQALLVSTDLDEMLETVLNLTFTHVPAESGAVCLLDAESGELHPRAVRAADGQLSMSRTIANRAISSRTALLVEDTGEDVVLSEAASVRRMKIHSAMCVPLYHDGEVAGVVYVDTRDESEPFRKVHLELLAALALYTAIAVEQARLRTRALEEEKNREKLSRYSSPAVVERILSSGGTMLADKADVSVLFADIKGFTPLAESLEPARTVELLNAVFTLMTDAVFRQEGTLDKFMGDGMLAFFGAPMEFADHAVRAVNAAVEIQESLMEFNTDRKEPPIEVRVGIESGQVVVGDIGSAVRKDYSVIGDTVNVASRLESSVATPGQIVIGPGTFALVQQRFDCEALPPATVQGKRGPIQAYVVLSRRGETQSWSTIDHRRDEDSEPTTDRSQRAADGQPGETDA